MAEFSEFVAAQDRVWADVRAELRAGRKTSHWIWFVFPQLAHLGRSERARHFGLSGLEEARRYHAHSVLGSRLAEVAGLLMDHRGTEPALILGEIDALKVRSSMTLFEAVAGAPILYGRILDEMYHGSRCEATRAELAS
ncbi:calpastatin [Roseivivax halodurans JCM 10272]|uniref:Calpastatin n=1 Tax=Roseivivax halodurans JCM 10272 TaxID=1449350 RepID=X7EIP8_9RHOB|nr:DUF1810 domain-containing protein [Roseivivax halodurans]ETX15018.1 calpastatin [Roseivivax halodurans JCM 10272]